MIGYRTGYLLAAKHEFAFVSSYYLLCDLEHRPDPFPAQMKYTVSDMSGFTQRRESGSKEMMKLAIEDVHAQSQPIFPHVFLSVAEVFFFGISE